MNKIITVIGVLLLAGVLSLALGFVPVGDPSPQSVTRQISAATPATAADVSFDTIAREAIVVDAATGTVLFDKASNTRMPTASMSKVMTLYMVFEALRDGKISLQDQFTVSEKAWRMGGSKMFIQVGTQVAVEDLIRGVAIQSGNDAAVALAEGVGGTEEEFAAAMTARAKEIGMLNSNFRNASGWPDPDHYSTAHDLAVLAYRIVTDFPQYYGYFGETEFSYNNITQQNRDPLLGRLAGADGLKTGHTEEAGYGLIGSAQREGRRIIMVVNGIDSMKNRADESVRIMEWAFRNFELKTIYGRGQEVVRVPVWLGSAPSVAAVAEADVKALLPRIGGGGVGVTAITDAPAHAPIDKGDRLGTLVIEVPGQPRQEIALVADDSVAREGFFGRIGARLSNLAGGSDEAEEAAPAADAATDATGSVTTPASAPAAATPFAPLNQAASATEETAVEAEAAEPANDNGAAEDAAPAAVME
jgi:D-alanyl-D-alanine carboxypeptidase (penicillin-binding protein 5/6)